MDQVTLGWLAFALLCAIVEAATVSFGYILVALGALVAAAISGLGYGLLWQVVAFSIATALSLIFLRPRILAKMDTSPGVPSRTDRLIGKTARVIEAIDPVTGGGRVLVEGHDWAALAGEAVAAGEEVTVEGADGIRLKVRRAARA